MIELKGGVPEPGRPPEIGYLEPLALTVEQAMAATGMSRDTLDDARVCGDPLYRYPNRKPVILVSDLRKWLEALSTSPPGRRPGRY